MREASAVNDAREEIIRFEDASVLRDLFGVNDAHLRALERALGVTIRPGGNEARVAGDAIPVELVGKVLSGLYRVLRRGIPVTGNDVEAAIRIVSADRNADVSVVFEDVVFKSSRNRTITPKSVAQKRYLDAIREFDIVFGVGPAGTGKTFLAMAMAVGYLLRKEVKRIVLVRPAVEAGEKLGFLPGDLAEKINAVFADYDNAKKLSAAVFALVGNYSWEQRAGAIINFVARP